THISSDELARLGLPARFAQFTVRKLTLAPGARSKSVLGSDAVAATIHRGLGEVTLLNFNVAALTFADSGKNFYESFLDLSARTSSGGMEIQSNAASVATGAAMDLLGDIPGVGTFGFGYV